MTSPHRIHLAIIVVQMLLSFAHQVISTRRASGKCIFPEYLQAGDNKDLRKWYGHVVHDKSSDDSFGLIVTFHDYMMQASVTGNAVNAPPPYTRTCNQAVNENTFIVLHSEQGMDEEMYACIQIIKRSPHVIQLKETDLHPDVDVETLCADGHFDMNYPYQWPFYNRIGLLGVQEPCSLVGGYNIRVYDPNVLPGNMHCIALEGETRLESECTNGDGMEFQFRHPMCVPEGMQMRVTQKTYCIGSWTEGVYKYSIIRHDRLERLWMLRYTQHDDYSQIGILFNDLVASTDRRPDPPSSYLRLDIVLDRDKQTASGALCMDGYEGCEVWNNPCQEQSSQQQLTCPKRCGLCDDTKPSLCTLPIKLHGQWVEDGIHGQRIHSIDTYSVLAQNISRMQCVNWQTGQYKDPDRLEQMTVTTFRNGCQPRYQCMQLYRRNKSVIRYKLSQSQHWPFDGTTGYNVDCSTFTYRDDPGTNGDGIRSRHHKILIARTERVYVKCRLPQTRVFEVTFNTEEPVNCNGSLSSDALQSPTKLSLNLYDCPDQTSIQQFACLDSATRGLRDDLMLVTESLDQSSQLRCWLFPSYSSEFYLLPASLCNEGSRERIQHHVLKPLAVFRDFNTVIPEHYNSLDSQYNNIVLVDNADEEMEVGKSSRQADSEFQAMDMATMRASSTRIKCQLFTIIIIALSVFYMF